VNINTANFCVWGFKHPINYNTFGHIHEAFYRALKYRYSDRQVLWLDNQDNISQIDFTNTLFITMEQAVHGMPRRQDCFYVCHNMEVLAKEYLVDYPTLNYGLYVNTIQLPSNVIELSQDSYFFPQPWETYDAVVFRWGTDLLPHEIEAYKPKAAFRDQSKVVNYVGSSITETNPFQRACEENGIQFRRFGGYSGGPPVPIQENIRLIRDSYMAPAISNAYHCSVGYIPCRVFKNLSYGQMVPTNNRFAQDFFKGRLIYNPDAYQLFFDARAQLPHTLKTLHDLMDEVAQKHTYLNKIDTILEAVKLAQESR